MVRVYPIIEPRDVLEHPGRVAEMLKQGIRMIQLRGGEPRETLEAARLLAPSAAVAGVTLIINNRVDIAKLVNAGVHLGQADLSVEDARRLLGTHAVIGVSTHSVAEAMEGLNADYISVGPIFQTTSKLDAHEVVGLETLREVRQALDAHRTAKGVRSLPPLVAIGGINRHNFRECLEAGASVVAAISCFRDVEGSEGLRDDAAAVIGQFK